MPYFDPNADAHVAGIALGKRIGEQVGLKKGFDHGHGVGYQDGYADGYNAGDSAGYEKAAAIGNEMLKQHVADKVVLLKHIKAQARQIDELKKSNNDLLKALKLVDQWLNAPR